MALKKWVKISLDPKGVGRLQLVAEFIWLIPSEEWKVEIL